jgi:hypothetical protein
MVVIAIRQPMAGTRQPLALPHTANSTPTKTRMTMKAANRAACSAFAGNQQNTLRTRQQVTARSALLFGLFRLRLRWNKGCRSQETPAMEFPVVDGQVCGPLTCISAAGAGG